MTIRNHLRCILGAVAPLLLLCLPSSPIAIGASFTPPPLTGPVVDTANMLDASTEGRLGARLNALWNQGGSQIAVLTLPTLGGLPIEQVSIQVTDQWQLGTKEKDNGVLLLIARDERELRIEVGQGLEGTLTDAQSRRIIDDVIVPYFKQGNFDAGVVAGVQAIVAHTDPQYDLGVATSGSPASTHSRTTGTDGSDAVQFFMTLFGVIIFLTLSRLLRRRGFHSRGRYRTGGFGTGGYRGGGFGGGFRGGGGGFSGGGASGRW